MNSDSELFPRELYHSYVIEGERDDAFVRLQDLLRKRESGDADMLCQSYDVLRMDDMPTIHQWHAHKNLGSKKIAIIAVRFINREAEHALLKILEEPKEDTHFFLIVPDASLLLDTIRSRVHIVALPSRSALKNTEAIEFIKASPKDRIDQIAALIKMHDDDENSGGIRFHAMSLVNQIEMYAHDVLLKNKTDAHTRFVLDELSTMREYLSTPGASVKMILEHIACVL